MSIFVDLKIERRSHRIDCVKFMSTNFYHVREKFHLSPGKRIKHDIAVFLNSLIASCRIAETVLPLTMMQAWMRVLDQIQFESCECEGWKFFMWCTCSKLQKVQV